MELFVQEQGLHMWRREERKWRLGPEHGFIRLFGVRFDNHGKLGGGVGAARQRN